MDASARTGGLNMNHTQVNQVLDHLKQGRTLTQADAIELFQCYRLSSVIHILRNQGFDIVTYNEHNTRRKGTHARYELKEFAA